MACALPLPVPSQVQGLVSAGAPTEPDEYVRVATYSLNRDKLVSNLVAGAAQGTPDITVSVKADRHNVNIQCSTAFFHAVAKPHLLQGGDMRPPRPIPGHPMVLSMPTPVSKDMDKTYLMETFLLRFEIAPNSFPPIASSDKPAKVTVHLHTTTCLVQVQGGTKMPDGETSAVWYCLNVLLPGFQNHGNQSFTCKSMSNLNKAIHDFFTKSDPSVSGPDICEKCEKVIRKNNKLQHCGACTQSYHKGCIRKHRCRPITRTPGAKPPSRSRLQSEAGPGPNSHVTRHRGHLARLELSSSSDSEAEVENVPSPSPVTHSTPVTFRPSALTHVLASGQNPSTTPLSRPPQPNIGQDLIQTLLFQPGQLSAAAQPFTSSAQTPDRVVQTQVTAPALPSQLPDGGPSAHALAVQGPRQVQVMAHLAQGAPPPPLVPTTVSSYRPATQPAPKARGKRREIGPAVTEASLEIEMLERSLTAAKVKITSLDSRLSEEQSRSMILLERVRIFEKRENDAAYSQFFPPSAPPTSPLNCFSTASQPAPQLSPPTQSVSTTSPCAVASCCPTSGLLLQSLTTLQGQVAGLELSMAHIISTLPTAAPASPTTTAAPPATTAAPPATPATTPATTTSATTPATTAVPPVPIRTTPATFPSTSASTAPTPAAATTAPTAVAAATPAASTAPTTPPAPASSTDGAAAAPPAQVPDITGPSAVDLLREFVGPVYSSGPAETNLPLPAHGQDQVSRLPPKRAGCMVNPARPPPATSIIHQVPSPSYTDIVTFPPPLWRPPPSLPPAWQASLSRPPPTCPPAPPSRPSQPPTAPGPPPLLPNLGNRKPRRGAGRGRGRGRKASPTEALLIDLNC